MNATTRFGIVAVLGLAFVLWQASQAPERLFAAIFAVSAIGYAFAPVIRDGVVG